MAETQTPENLSGVSLVLITGGTGLTGRYLTSALLSEGCKDSHLLISTGTPGDEAL